MVRRASQCDLEIRKGDGEGGLWEWGVIVRARSPHATATELEVASQVAALVVGALEVEKAALDQPVDLEPDPRVDETVEVTVGVFER